MLKRGYLWIYSDCDLLCSLGLWVDIFFFLIKVCLTCLLNSNLDFSFHYISIPFSLFLSLSPCIHISFYVFSVDLCLISLIHCSVANLLLNMYIRILISETAFFQFQKVHFITLKLLNPLVKFYIFSLIFFLCFYVVFNKFIRANSLYTISGTYLSCFSY